MKRHLRPGLAVLFLSAAIARADPPPGRSLTGHYVLTEHVKGVDALDGIDFHPDKTCTLEYDGTNGLPGNYQLQTDGSLNISLTGGAKFTYRFKQMKMTLVLSQQGEDDLNYDQVPDQPSKLAFKDVLGAYYLHTDQLDDITEIDADHTFRAHIHTFNQDGTYTDMHFDGKCTYANGIITYLPVHSSVADDDLFQRDVAIKHDEKGLWVIDPMHDELSLETPAKNLDLPPPPPQYSKPANPQ